MGGWAPPFHHQVPEPVCTEEALDLPQGLGGDRSLLSWVPRRMRVQKAVRDSCHAVVGQPVRAVSQAGQESMSCLQDDSARVCERRGGAWGARAWRQDLRGAGSHVYTCALGALALSLWVTHHQDVKQRKVGKVPSSGKPLGWGQTEPRPLLPARGHPLML